VRRFRICVATSYTATAEPRAARYAAELARLDPARCDVLFIDCVPRGQVHEFPEELAGLPNVRHRTVHYAWRGDGRLRLVWEKLRQYLARLAFRLGAAPAAAGLSTRSLGLGKILAEEKADLYFGFNIDTLLPVYRAARASSAPFLFDCQEIYAEMSHGQSKIERDMIRAAESLCLPSCSLVLAVSAQAANYIERTCGIDGVLPLLNTPPIEDLPECEPAGEFTLYWRNGTIDLGPRGLQDALNAMPLLPEGITLYLQGRKPAKGGERMEQLIRDLGIGRRVVFVPPYRPSEAVQVAARYTVGLALENPTSINSALTTSNKFFDYAIAGLAVVSSRTEGLEQVIDAAGLGLMYQAGDAADLARQILRLYEDRTLLARMRAAARAFALQEGNLEFQMRRFRDALRQRVPALWEGVAAVAPAKTPMREEVGR